MTGAPVRYRLISDFNLETLARILRNNNPQKPAQVTVTPYGQAFQSLLALQNPSGFPDTDEIGIVWTQPQSIVKTYTDATNFLPYDTDAALAEVNAFADVLNQAASNLRALFITRWTSPSAERGLGPLDYRPGYGARILLDRMNIQLADRLASSSNIFFLEPDRWIGEAGGNAAWTPALWYAAKAPFSSKVYQAASNDILSYTQALGGHTKKLIILDLDDTLWGGIVGETGWQGITLGGHSHAGEAFQDFQRALKALTQRGVLLALCSKNDEPVAFEAIDKHPEMILRRADFATWRINWQDKASNIRSILEEINLGADAVLFIDDNPAERGLVSENFPQILVPDWPKNPALYPAALKQLTCFDSVALSDEDRQRASYYAAERMRRTFRDGEETGSSTAWLERLEISVTVEELNQTNLSRAAQLLNKTNQMNLSTRRMTEAELANWNAAPDRKIWTFRVADRFGDYGLTGIISGEHEGDTVSIIDFVLSCRVMGRQVEGAMVHQIFKWAKEQGARHLEARFVPTERNRPCHDFWTASGFEEIHPHHFRWVLDTPYAVPDALTLKAQAAA